MVARLSAREVLDESKAVEEDADEYEDEHQGAEAIETLLSSQGLEFYVDFEDDLSVE